MIVRPYTSSDFEWVKALHKMQGLAYELPDLEAPQMLVRTVIEEHGEITHAAFLRKTAEAYWLFGKQTRRERLGRMLVLQKEMTPAALRAGFVDVHSWIPPAVLSPAMHKTLLRVGWQKPEWVSYFKPLE